MRFVLLNSTVIRPGLIALAEQASLEEARAVAPFASSSFIGHPGTAALLGVAVNRGEYTPEAGDVAYVIRLKRRPQVSGDVAEVGPEDLEVLRVRYFDEGLLFGTLFEFRQDMCKEIFLYHKFNWLTSLLQSIAVPNSLLEARRLLASLKGLMRIWDVTPEDLECGPAGPVLRELERRANLRALIPEAFQALEEGREASGEATDLAGTVVRWEVRVTARTPGFFYWVRAEWEGDELRGPCTARSALVREFGTELPSNYSGPAPVPAERREYGLFVETEGRWLTANGLSDVPVPYDRNVVEVEAEA